MGKIYTTPFDWGYVDDNTLIYTDTSEEGIKSMINEALDEAIDDVKEEIVDETMSNMDIKLEGGNLLYKLIVNGNENGEINIPKDQFLKSTSYDKENKKLIFVMETEEGENTIEVSISDLVASIEEKNQEQDVVLEEKADKSELEPLATKEEVQAVDAKVDALEIPSVDGFAKAEEVTAEIAAAVEPLATKAEVEAVDAKVDAIDLTPYATVEALNQESERATAKETEIEEALNVEAQRATAAESELQGKDAELLAKIDQVKSDVETELEAKADKSELEPLATKEEMNALDEKKVDWTESTPGRKHIVLKNHDSVLGTATDGGTYNVAMVSKWDVADFGSAQLHLNLNSKDAATINDNKVIATEDFVADSIATAVEPLATKQEVNDAAANAVAQVIANAPEDFDTLKEVADYIASDKTKASEIEATLNEHGASIEALVSKDVEMEAAKADKSELEPLAKKVDVTAEIAAAVEPLATKAEVEAVDEKKVDWTESTPGRKHIVLKNHDSVLGTATDGNTYNVAMVSKWDVADFGSTSLHLNLNSKDGVATINDDKQIATVDEVAAVDAKVSAIDLTPFAKTEDVNAELALKADKSELEPLATKAEMSEAAANAVAQVVANAPEDLDTLKEVADYIAADKTKAVEIENKLAELTAKDAELVAKDEAQDADIALKADKSELEPLAKKVDVTTEIEQAVEPLATKAEVEAVDEKKVDWTESTPGRKHIVLKNHDSVLGTATDGTTYNVAMVSKWDVADFGSAQLHLNLNTSDEVTINDNYPVATQKWVGEQGFLTEHQDISELATKDELDDAVASAIAEVVANAPEDLNTLKEVADYIASDKTKATEIESKLAQHDATIETLATKAEVQAVDAKVDALVIPSIEGLAVASEVAEDIATAVAPLATKAEVEAVDAKVDAIVVPSVEGLASEEYVDNTVEGYVPVEQYNELKARLDNLEIMMSVYNAEREAQMDEIISNMSSDNKELVIDTLMESIVVPETTVAYTITAPLTDNSTVELTSPKYMTLINTSKEPVSTTISHTYEEGESTSATAVYLVGDFNTLTLENVSPNVKSGYDAASVKNVVISENNVKNLSLYLDFQDGATITNNSDKDITIYDRSNSEVALSIVAPNSTVTLNNGQFTTLNAEVSDNTLIIKKNVHIGNLNLAKGNAIVEVARPEEVANIVENYTVADGYTLSHRVYHITNENSSKLGGVGEMILDEDITRTSSIISPLAPAYDAVWNLNGHNITVEGTPKNGLYLNRYASNLEVKGNGVIHAEGSYGLWNVATTGKIIINDGVTIEAQTHAVYAEKGVIEINGGTFKLTNWADAEKDVNGNLKFLINCYDANYTNGSANIIVKGGKFYDFNPAESYGELNGPVSFVADGYGSVKTTETIDGVEHNVYEVKPING